MVTFTKEDKNIIIPCSLGNFSTGSGGSGVTPEDVEIMIDQAIDTYDEGIQGQFNSTNTAVSGNTENIEAISAKTQSIANDLDSLGNSVENLSGVTSGISNDLTSLGNDVEELSGVTSGISNDLTSLGNDVEELSGVTSGIATDLETLSANTTVVSWEQSLSAGTQIAQITINGQSQSVFAPEGAASDAVIYDYNEVNGLSSNEKIAVWRKMLQEKIDGKQVWFRRIVSETIYWYIMNRGSAGTGAHFFYAFDNNYIYTLSFNYNGTFAPSLSLSQKEILPKASSSTLGGIKVGSGLTIDGNGVLSADGGGGDSNYVIVDALSAITNPVEGMIAYVKGTTSSITIDEYKIQAPEGYTEGWTPLAEYSVDGNIAFQIYMHTNDVVPCIQAFNSSFEELWLQNDGNWHNDFYTEFEGNLYQIEYKIHIDYDTYENSYILLEASLGGLTGAELVGISGRISEEQEQETVTTSPKTYRYNGTAWEDYYAPKVIDFDAMSQAELVALFTEIYAKWTGSSINGEYLFLKSFIDYTPENQGTRQMRLQFMTAEGNSTLDFSTTTYSLYEDNGVKTWIFRLYSDGTYNAYTGNVRGVDKDMSNVGYFDGWNEALCFDKTTSAFTHNGETITDGASFGGSFYWFIVNAAQGSWGIGVPLLMFEVTDENSVVTTYQYPSMSKKPVSITIGDITYDTEAKFNYGEISLKMYLDSNPAVAGLTVIQNY